MFDTVESFWDAGDLVAAEGEARRDPAGATATFERRFARFVGAEEAVFLSSGRVALNAALLLAAVKPGDEVIVPAFLCRAVVQAVEAAGRAGLCNVTVPSGVPTLAQLLAVHSTRTRAAIVPHLFGIPSDWSEASDALAREGIALIEDCAHTLGACTAAAPAGQQGRFGVYSFGFDKPLSLGGGGMLVVGHAAGGSATSFDALRSARAVAPAQDEAEELGAFVGWLARRHRALDQSPTPWRRALDAVVGRLRRHARRPDPDHRLRVYGEWPIGSVRAALGVALLERYPAVRDVRNANATRLREALDGHPTIRLPPLGRDAHAAFLRGMCVVDGDPAAATKRLREGGFRSGRLNWPRALHQVAQLRARVVVRSGLAGAETMAAHSINLPIHQQLTDSHIDAMVSLLLGAT